MHGLVGPLCLGLWTLRWPSRGVRSATVGTKGCDRSVCILGLPHSGGWGLLTASSFPSRMLAAEELEGLAEMGCPEDGGAGAHLEDTVVLPLSEKDGQVEQMLVSGRAGTGGRASWSTCRWPILHLRPAFRPPWFLPPGRCFNLDNDSCHPSRRAMRFTRVFSFCNSVSQ